MFESFTQFQSRTASANSNTGLTVRSPSMTKRIVAIVFIFICASVAWAVLGGTIFSRTYDLNQVSGDHVASTWGTPQNQSPPKAAYVQVNTRDEQSVENGTKIVRKVEEKVEVPLPLDSSRIDVALDLEHRQKGLLWYSTYTVNYGGVYSFHNPSDKEQSVNFTLGYPAAQAIYDDVVFTVDEVPLVTTNAQNAAVGVAKIAPGKTTTL